MTQIRKPRTPASPRHAAACSRPIDRTLDPALFKALGDPTRAVLVACIAKCARPCTVGEVAECCSVDLSVVSRHLSLLARAGILEPTREGRVVRYQVRYASLSGSLRAMAAAIDECCPTPRTRKGTRDGCC